MAAVLGTNMASVWASKNLRSAQSNMASSVERLSSGLAINRAKDELLQENKFDLTIVNDDLDTAIEKAEEIVKRFIEHGQF